jgi:hypothetical protein
MRTMTDFDVRSRLAVPCFRRGELVDRLIGAMPRRDLA